MNEPTRLYSTNHSTPEVGLREALLLGQAGDRGLFLPNRFERFSPAELAELAAKDYAHVAHMVLRRFTGGMMDDEVLQALCDDAYDYEVPIEQVTGQRYVMRLQGLRRSDDGALAGIFHARGGRRTYHPDSHLR